MSARIKGIWPAHLDWVCPGTNQRIQVAPVLVAESKMSVAMPSRCGRNTRNPSASSLPVRYWWKASSAWY